jgi:hypothetical protein
MAKRQKLHLKQIIWSGFPFVAHFAVLIMYRNPGGNEQRTLPSVISDQSLWKGA